MLLSSQKTLVDWKTVKENWVKCMGKEAANAS